MPRPALLLAMTMLAAPAALAQETFTGQFALGARYPVGAVTGAIGAPHLIHLIIRTNRAGRTI